MVMEKPRRAKVRNLIPLTVEHAAPPTAREWVSFEDPHERRHWVFDVSFMLSSWTCIFGAGCQGVLTGPTPELMQGCCSYGAHFVDEEDAAHVQRVAATLTADEWQFRKKGRKGGILKHTKDGDIVTRQAEGACIFLNRPGWPGGAGCALHAAALNRGARPLDYKPSVCWQLPLRREEEDMDNGWVTSRVIPWERHHWGAGGAEFHWWCIDAPDAFGGKEPVYVTLREELVEMVGLPVYELVAAYLDARRSGTTPVAFPPERN
jgi:hypothetical protein